MTSEVNIGFQAALLQLNSATHVNHVAFQQNTTTCQRNSSHCQTTLVLQLLRLRGRDVDQRPCSRNVSSDPSGCLAVTISRRVDATRGGHVRRRGRGVCSVPATRALLTQTHRAAPRASTPAEIREGKNNISFLGVSIFCSVLPLSGQRHW